MKTTLRYLTVLTIAAIDVATVTIETAWFRAKVHARTIHCSKHWPCVRRFDNVEDAIRWLKNEHQ